MRLIALEEHMSTPAVQAANRRLSGQRQQDFERILPGHRAAELADVGDGRIAAMDRAGIDVQVLSHVPPAVQELEAETSVALARAANDAIAAAIHRHPTRFGGFAALPTVVPDAAADELTRCVQQLGFSGAMIHGQTHGRFLDAPLFDPILHAAATLGVPLYVHPGEPPRAVKEHYYGDLGTGDGSAALELLFATSGWGWHVDTAVHALRLILSGALDRHPSLQLILGHWGELLPFYADRIDGTLSRFARHLERPVGAYLRENVYVTPSGLETLPPMMLAIETLGADRIMFSTDYPYVPTQGADYLESAPISACDRAKIAHGNAERLLPGLPTSAT